jgi:mono/diheme cytochrome c family protein
MRKLTRITVFVLASVVILVVLAFAYLNFTYPKVDPAPELTVNPTPELIARGEYLANHVALCMDCHSQRDFSRYSGPPTPGTEGAGGDRFDQTMGMPGVFYAKNITPFGISRYTDGELFRVITTGVTKENKALFPIMPYPYYGQMAEDDIHAIIAYLRSLPPVESQIPDSKADFPFSLILKTIPVNASPQPRPQRTDEIAYGKYMATFAACMECHTPVEKGQIVAEQAFSGGREFLMPGGVIMRTPNITPHSTGLGQWTEEMFIAKFKNYENNAYTLSQGDMNTIMPWSMYAGMDTVDLKAIYAYLKTVPAIEKTVVKYEQVND